MKFLPLRHVTITTLLALITVPVLARTPTAVPVKRQSSVSGAVADHLTPHQSFVKKYVAATTPAERAEVMSIERALGAGEEITPEMRTRYWQITDKARPTPLELQFITGIMALSDYKVHLYQDALVAFRTGKPFLSPQRAAEERTFLANVASEPAADQKADLATQKKNLAQDHLIITDIAAHKPVPFPDGTVVFTEEMLTAAISNAQHLSQQAHFLLTHP